MGIYDREYYRHERSGFFGALSGRGSVCKWLIGANVVVFLIQMMTQRAVDVRIGGVALAALDLGPFTNALLLDIDAVLQGQVWRLLTYAFLHDPDSLWHIVLNMWFLWMFGPDLEDLYGPREFLTFYLAAAVVAGMGFVLLHMAGVPGTRCLGASGAVCAVLVLCALHFPNRTILLFFVIPVPIWLFLFIMLVPDAYAFIRALRHRLDPGNAAVTVHLTGALFAFLYYKRQWRLLNLVTELRTWQRQRARPRLRVYREEPPDEPVTVTVTKRSDVDEHLEAKVDAVLEKVAKYGQESLSESERQILLRASEVYKRRRT
jgi:membrane associated rhomboid family serine protease